MGKNSAILSQAFIESFGSGIVTELLDKNARILTYWDVDSLGCILKFSKLISKDEFPLAHGCSLCYY